MDAERQRLLNRAARLLGRINQLYTDASYWNSETRVRLYPEAEPIDPDPTGEMARWKRALEAELKTEAELGHFPDHEP